MTIATRPAARPAPPIPNLPPIPHDAIWITSREGGEILRRNGRAVRLLARAGLVRRHAIPGLAIKYLKSDIERYQPMSST